MAHCCRSSWRFPRVHLGAELGALVWSQRARTQGGSSGGKPELCNLSNEEAVALAARFTQVSCCCDACAPPDDALSRWELAPPQATSELQLLGYVKPARRQRHEVAERLIFPHSAE